MKKNAKRPIANKAEIVKATSDFIRSFEKMFKDYWSSTRLKTSDSAFVPQGENLISSNFCMCASWPERDELIGNYFKVKGALGQDDV